MRSKMFCEKDQFHPLHTIAGQASELLNSKHERGEKNEIIYSDPTKFKKFWREVCKVWKLRKLVSQKNFEFGKTQCGNFRIFLALRFYVKSILENLEVLYLLLFAILGTLNFVNLVNFTLQNMQKCIEIKPQSPQMW